MTDDWIHFAGFSNSESVEDYAISLKFYRDFDASEKGILS